MLDWTVLSWNFWGIIWNSFRGVCRHIIYRDYTVNRTSYIYCSVAYSISMQVNSPSSNKVSAMLVGNAGSVLTDSQHQRFRSSKKKQQQQKKRTRDYPGNFTRYTSRNDCCEICSSPQCVFPLWTLERVRSLWGLYIPKTRRSATFYCISVDLWEMNLLK